MSFSPRALWRKIVLWLRTQVQDRRELLTSEVPRPQSAATLGVVFGATDCLDQAIVGELENLLEFHPGVVSTTVQSALADYRDLHTLLDGPAKRDVVDDVSILGETEAALAELVVRAGEVAILAKVAGTRQADRRARQAAGDAILDLQDRQRALGTLTSSALQWASSRTREDLEEYRRCAALISATFR